MAMGQAVVGRNISDQFSPGKMPSKIATLKNSQKSVTGASTGDGKDRLLCGKCSLKQQRSMVGKIFEHVCLACPLKECAAVQ